LNSLPVARGSHKNGKACNSVKVGWSDHSRTGVAAAATASPPGGSLEEKSGGLSRIRHGFDTDAAINQIQPGRGPRVPSMCRGIDFTE